MKISLVTPSRDRSQAFAVVQHCIARQTLEPHEWIVVRDGNSDYSYALNQRVICRPSKKGEPHSTCSNLLEAFKHVTGDIVAIIPDDDWYGPEYLERIARSFESSKEPVCFACPPVLYYQVSQPSLFNVSRREYPDVGQISFDLNHGTNPRVYIEHLCGRGDPAIDRCLFRHWHGGRSFVPNEKLHLGLKGTPGTPGIDSFHKMKGISDNADRDLLKACIGDDRVAFDLIARL